MREIYAACVRQRKAPRLAASRGETERRVSARRSRLRHTAFAGRCVQVCGQYKIRIAGWGKFRERWRSSAQGGDTEFL